MKPFFYISNYRIPSYGAMVIVGLFFASFYLAIFIKKNIHLHRYIEEICIYSALGAFLGAKLLYVIINIPEIRNDFCDESLSLMSILYKYFAGGFVFYGGIYGFLLALALYSYKEKLIFLDLACFMLPAFTITHAFGRIGCFLVGCCYGKESVKFGIVYHNSIIAPNNIPLIPIQIIESIFVFLISILLIIMILKKVNSIAVFSIYIISYSVFRFFIEFYRGDEIRKFLSIFSTSQWLSIVNVLFMIAYLLIKFKHKKITDKK